MGGFRQKLDYLLKHNRAFNVVFHFIASAAMRLLGVFVRLDEKSILFSAHGRKYNDSPRSIYERMKAQDRFSGYTFYWALEDVDNADIPGDCIKVKADTFRYFLTALKCKYWITCVNIERGLHFKKKDTVYLNTWHGIPIKTIGNAAAGRKDYDFSNIDLFCVSGEWEVELYRRSFNVLPEHIIRVGLPRNDELYHVTEQEVAGIRERLGIPDGKKVILYAPTWRDSKDGGSSYVIKPPVNLRWWKEKLGGDYVLLFRAHPYTTRLLDVQFDDFVIDCTAYPSVNELMKAADVLISDYSATIFDYSILERPIFCFAYDLEEYSRARGFNLDLRTLFPEGVYEDEKALVEALLGMDYRKCSQAARALKQRYVEFGGDATARCIDCMFNGIRKGERK